MNTKSFVVIAIVLIAVIASIPTIAATIGIGGSQLAFVSYNWSCRPNIEKCTLSNSEITVRNIWNANEDYLNMLDITYVTIFETNNLIWNISLPIRDIVRGQSIEVPLPVGSTLVVGATYTIQIWTMQSSEDYNVNYFYGDFSYFGAVYGGSSSNPQTNNVQLLMIGSYSNYENDSPDGNVYGGTLSTVIGLENYNNSSITINQIALNGESVPAVVYTPGVYSDLPLPSTIESDRGNNFISRQSYNSPPKYTFYMITLYTNVGTFQYAIVANSCQASNALICQG